MKISHSLNNGVGFHEKETKMPVKTDNKDVSFCLQNNSSNSQYNQKKEEKKAKPLNLELLFVKNEVQNIDKSSYYLRLLNII